MRTTLLGLALMFVGTSCGNLEALEMASCSKGNECAYPFVCCTDPRLPDGEHTPPYCDRISSCNAMLPPLDDGHPCNRQPSASALGLQLQSCVAPLACCAKTLTCQTTASCDSAPEPKDGEVVSQACHADTDCPQDSVCCGISLGQRDGTCRSVVACKSLFDAQK